MATWKYDANGPSSSVPDPLQLSKQFQLCRYLYDLALDGLGNIVVVGYRGQSGRGRDHEKSRLARPQVQPGGSPPLVGHLRHGGQSVRNRREGGGRQPEQTHRRRVSEQGDEQHSNANFDWLVIKYAADGSEAGQRLWTETYESAPGYSESAAGIAVDPDDNIFVAAR